MKLDNVAELIKGLVDKTYQKYDIIPPSNFISQTHQHTSPFKQLCNYVTLKDFLIKVLFLHLLLTLSLFNIFKSQKDPLLLINQSLSRNIELFVSKQIQENIFLQQSLSWSL